MREAEKKPPENRRKTERAHALEALERGRLHRGAGPGRHDQCAKCRMQR